jgi:DeoR family transcriptional regulator of aga operon
MTRTDRLTAILDLLAETGQVEVEEIVTRLGVSPATARRDLDSLAKRRLLTRTRGGATTGALAYDLPGRYNRDDHAVAKQEIALAASALIALAQILATREDLNSPSNQPTLTVVTNAINIASQLAVRPNIKVMVTGGILNTRSYELVGPYTDIIMQKVVLDIAFIGVNGVDAEVGPTNTGEAEATVNALLASRASLSYVIADSSKVGRRAFATMDGYNFTRLITDAGISAADKAAFEARGTEVIVAGA